MLLGCCVDPNRLPLVLEAGFDYAELPVRAVLPDEPEAVWKAECAQILSHGTPILGFNVLLPSTMSVVGPDVDTIAVTTYLETVFRRMAELGGKNVVFGSGGARRVPEGYSVERASKQLIDFLRVLNTQAERHGITAHIEFLNRRETNIINSLLEARTFAIAIGSPWLRILADLYHIDEEQEPIRDMIEVADVLGYVHVADSGRRYPGSGQYPYGEFISTLRRIDYCGPVSVECTWGEEVAREMARAAAFLREQFS